VTPNGFIVRDANGQALAYVCFEDEPGRRSGNYFDANYLRIFLSAIGTTA